MPVALPAVLRRALHLVSALTVIGLGGCKAPPLPTASVPPVVGPQRLVVPVDGFTAVSSGGQHTCGLRADGTVVC